MGEAYTRRTVIAAGAAAAGGLFLGTRAAFADPAPAPDPWDEVPRILSRISPPTFPNRVFPVTTYGAAGDGVTDDTVAFSRAILACALVGGGRVLVPPGRYLTGAIHLRSNVELHVEAGATIAFSTDPAKYLPVVFTRYEGTECWNYSPFVYAYGQHNVAITGDGTLDGQGPLGPWAKWGSGGADSDLLRQMGRTGVPVNQRVFGAGHKLRPNMVQFYRCSNVLVDGVTVINPAMWTIHPVLCTNVTVRNVTVHSTNNQGDGCDLESCTDAHVVGSRFDTNDDCITLKSGRNEDGVRVGVPTSNVVIEGCRFSGRWGGVTVGSEMSGGVSNIWAQDCLVNSPDFPGHYPIKFALYIKTNKLRGGVIDGVHLRRFTGQAVEREALYVTLNYNGGEGGTNPVYCRNIDVSGFTIDGARTAVYLDGLATDHITGVRVADSVFTNVANPNTLRFADDVTLTNVTINGVPA